MRIPAWAPRVAVAIALAALIVWSFVARWTVLTAVSEPLGVDGYFYPIELRSLLEHGTLQFATAPLTLWWMLPFAAASDPIVGAKLAAALGSALIAVPAYGVGARLGRSRPAGLVCALIATTSAGSAYLTIEFVKQGIGLTVALTAVWCSLVALERRSRGRVIAAGVALIAALLAHKLAATLALIIVVIAAVEDMRMRGVLRGRRLLYVLGAVTAGGALLLVLGMLAPRRFASPTDLELIRGLLTSRAHWFAPALGTPRLTLWLDHEALIGGIVALSTGVVLVHGGGARAHAERVAAWCFVVLGIVLVLPWLSVSDPQGLAFRLRVCAFVPLAVCAAVLIGAISARGQVIASAIAFVVVLAIPRDRAAGEVRAHPSLVAASRALTEHIPPGATVIVGERHVEYMVAWYTRAEVNLRPELVPYISRVRVVLAMSPVHHNFPLEPALDEARRQPGLEPPVSLHPDHRDGFVLVTEPTWDWILTRLPPLTRAHWEAWPTI